MLPTRSELFVLILIFFRSDCFYLISEINFRTNEDFHLINAIVNIVTRYHSLNGSHFHVVNAAGSENLYENNDIIKHFIKVTKSIVQIENVEGISRNQQHKRYSSVIFVDSFDSLLKFLSKLSSKNFKFRRFFLIVLTKEFTLDEMEKSFEHFWRISIKNVDLIVRQSNSEVNLFTYLPFNKFNKCGDTPPVKINSYDESTGEWKTDKFYPIKVSNLHKCPLIIGCAVGTAQPWLINEKLPNGSVLLTGIEKDIFVEISLQMNFEPKFEIHGKSPGSVYENGTATGEC